MLISTHWSRDKMKEHVQEVVHSLGGHEMIRVSQSRSIDPFSHATFERKQWSLSDLDVAQGCRAGERECVGLALT